MPDHRTTSQQRAEQNADAILSRVDPQGDERPITAAVTAGEDGAPVVFIDGDCPGLRIRVNDSLVWRDTGQVADHVEPYIPELDDPTTPGAAGEDAPIDVSAASWLQRVRDAITIANWDETDAIMEWRCYDVAQVREILTTSAAEMDEETLAEVNASLDLLDRLDRDVPEYPGDVATEIVDGLVYGITEFARRSWPEGEWDTGRVQLLLGGGGPTILATCSLDDGRVAKLTYWHSWGAAVGTEDERTFTDSETVEMMDTLLSMLGYGDR